MRWTVDADKLVRVVNSFLLENREVANWLGELCNHDMGAILRMCRDIVLSPHLAAEALLRIQTQSSERISRYKTLKAILAPKDQHYRPDASERVTDVFGFWLRTRWAPLLPARMLAVLRKRERTQRNTREPDAGFVDTCAFAEDVASHLGIPHEMVWGVLHELHAKELIETYALDRAELVANTSSKIKITSCGKLHLEWTLDEMTYVRMMAEVSPVVRADDHAELSGLHQRFVHSLTEHMSPDVVRQSEAAFVGRFVAYVLDEAARVSPAPRTQTLRAVGEFDAELRQRWCNVQGRALQAV